MIPSSWNLATLATGAGSARRLQKALDPIRKSQLYDFVVIDTPPTVGELQYNALQAATGLIIPVMADSYNLLSLRQMAATAKQFQKTNKELEILGIVFSQLDQRSTISRQMKDTIIAAAEKLGIPYLADIRSAVCVKEAAALQRSLFDYAPKSKPAADYLALFKKIRE